MAKRLAPLVALLVLPLVPGVPAAPPGSQPADGFDRLLALFAEWRAFQKPRVVDGVPDYTPAAMAEQARRLPELEARLAAIDTAGWPVSRRVDHRLVEAEMNGLDFDHRVLRPWARDPAFYAMVVESQSDTPSREGPTIEGAIELWKHSFPLPSDEASRFRARLQAIPRVLAQARANLVGDARDLWLVGIRAHREQAALLAALAGRLRRVQPDLAPDVERAREAEEAFRAWLEETLPSKRGPSGVGRDGYDWYLRHVHLVPYTWQDEMALVQRELARSRAHLALEEHRNRPLPPLEPAATAEEWQRRADEAFALYMRFLREREVLTVTDDLEPALRARLGSFVPAGRRDFFSEVDAREPLLLRCHGFHWFDLARMEHAPHPSPVRRGPLLYNIWDSRSEGMATAMEEWMMTAGLFEGRPRGREIIWIGIAQRAARAIAGLRMQANEWTIEEAVRFAAGETPRGWLRADGDTVWGEQQLYLEQPGYGTSYLTGKALLEDLLAERAAQLGAGFTLKGFVDEVNASGMIPVSLIRWETTGREPRP
jgi:hypothetical protein